MSYNNIILSEQNRVAIITINRPKVLNALNTQTIIEIKNMLEELERDEKVKCIIITGSGERSFSAGADVKELKGQTVMEHLEFVEMGNNVFLDIENSQKPYIAAINGYALGGGLELALSCDIRIASSNVRLGFPEITIGGFPGWGGTKRLSRLIGLGYAKEMIYTGEKITAEEAHRIGLVNKVKPQEELIEYCTKFANKIADMRASTLRIVKDVLNRGSEMSVNNAVAYEAKMNTLNFFGKDRQEGLKSFLEKRPASFKDVD